MITIDFDQQSNLCRYWQAARVPGDVTYMFSQYMRLKHFENIQKHFTISSESVIALRDKAIEATTRLQGRQTRKTRPLSSTPGLFFEKLLPLVEHIRKACQKYYTPGTHLAINEIMLPFPGRSSRTKKLKNKPVKEGYKI